LHHIICGVGISIDYRPTGTMATGLSSCESPLTVTYYCLVNGSFLLSIYNIKNDHDILDKQIIVVNHFKEA